MTVIDLLWRETHDMVVPSIELQRLHVAALAYKIANYIVVLLIKLILQEL